MCLKLYCCFGILIPSVTLDHNHNSNGAPTDKARLHPPPDEVQPPTPDKPRSEPMGCTGQEYTDPVFKRYSVSLCMHAVCHVCVCIHAGKRCLA